MTALRAVCTGLPWPRINRIQTSAGLDQFSVKHLYTIRDRLLAMRAKTVQPQDDDPFFIDLMGLVRLAEEMKSALAKEGALAKVQKDFDPQEVFYMLCERLGTDPHGSARCHAMACVMCNLDLFDMIPYPDHKQYTLMLSEIFQVYEREPKDDPTDNLHKLGSYLSLAKALGAVKALPLEHVPTVSPVPRADPMFTRYELEVMLNSSIWMLYRGRDVTTHFVLIELYALRKMEYDTEFTRTDSLGKWRQRFIKFLETYPIPDGFLKEFQRAL